MKFTEKNAKRQKFALPAPLIHLMRKKAKASAYLKLRKTCKEFFIRRRECLARSLFFGQNQRPLDFDEKTDLFFRRFPRSQRHFPSNLVFLQSLDMKIYDARIFEKIRHHRLQCVYLPQCTISSAEFDILRAPQTIKIWNLPDVTILNSNQNIMELGEFLNGIGKARHVL